MCKNILKIIEHLPVLHIKSAYKFQVWQTLFCVVLGYVLHTAPAHASCCHIISWFIDVQLPELGVCRMKFLVLMLLIAE
jgi:hypothetical protein